MSPEAILPPSLFRRLALALIGATSRSKLRVAPSADRNKAPIADVLQRHPPFDAVDSGWRSCIEIASGTGQHCAYFADKFPHVVFQPTEYAGGSAGPEEPAYGDLSPVFSSIIAHAGGKRNVRAPIALDAAAPRWPDEVEAAATVVDAVYCCNICHISPIEVTHGIFAGAARLLVPGTGRLFIYGPFMVDGAHTAPSNAEFDARLRAQNPSWGVRDATELADLAARSTASL